MQRDVLARLPTHSPALYKKRSDEFLSVTRYSRMPSASRSASAWCCPQSVRSKCSTRSSNCLPNTVCCGPHSRHNCAVARGCACCRIPMPLILADVLQPNLAWLCSAATTTRRRLDATHGCGNFAATALYVDQNVTGLLLQRPSAKLRKMLLSRIVSPGGSHQRPSPDNGPPVHIGLFATVHNLRALSKVDDVAP